MKKWFIAAGTVVFFTMSALGGVFSGAGADQLFSNMDNWSTYPVNGDKVSISANGTSEGAPALVDPGFGVDVGTFKLYSDGGSWGKGISYVHVVSGGTIKASNIFVGNAEGERFAGELVVERGGTIVPRYAKSGGLAIGGSSSGTYGSVRIESGATVSFSKMNLNETGVLTFEMGTDSVSTFKLTEDKEPSLLNGLLQVDLGALTTVGNYKLLDSTSGLAGTLIDDLTASGGTITAAGQSACFKLLNAEGFAWSLAIANGGRDLVLTVTAISKAAPVS